jgi:hypothetical protein
VASGDRARAIAPAALLLVIALIGVRNHVVRDQSSWQGASFGMFATYDSRVSRQVVATLHEDGEVTRLAIPADLGDDARRLTVVPTGGGARSMARAIVSRVDGDASVRIEVRGPVLEQGADGLELRLTVLAAGSASR